MKWISVDKKLPEDGDYVIAWRGVLRVWSECQFLSDEFVNTSGDYQTFQNVTHWMIPCDPKELSND